MNRKERERHLAKLGTSITEDVEEDNKEEPLTQTEVIGSFKDSGLPEFLKGSWTNANKIVQLNGIGSFPNDDSSRIVISLSGPFSHTVQIAGKKLACVDCPRYSECGICAHTLAVAHHLDMLSSYVKSYKVPLEKMVRATIPNGAGKKDNERKNICKRRKILPVMCHNTGIALMLKPQLSLILPMKLFLLLRQRLQHATDARDAYGTKHQIHPRLPHMIFSCSIRSVVYISEAGKARFASQRLQRRCITIHCVHVPH